MYAKGNEFRAKLLALMDMTGGQPARGPEITSIQHSNTPRNQHRSVFIDDGKVVFVTRYHKGYHLQGDIKIIHRCLPHAVGEKLVHYLWLVLPFVQTMSVESEGKPSYMWPADRKIGKGWEGGILSKVLKQKSTERIRQGFGMYEWRDIAIAISRKFWR